MKQTERNEYIDAIRGAVIILMLVGHSGAPKNVTTFIYGFHMPFFFILSGLLYNRTKWEQKGLKKLVIAKFKAYIIPYFILCGINLLIEFIYDYLNGFTMMQLYKEVTDSIFWVIYSYSTKARMATSVPLWFLPCIFLSTIFTYLFLKISNKLLRGLVISVAVAFNIILSFWKFPIFPWHFGIAMVGAFFMIVGYYGKRVLDGEKIPFYPLVIATLFAVFTVCTLLTGKTDVNMRSFGSHPLLFIIGSIAMSMALLFVFKNNLPNSKALVFLGQNTMLIMGFNYTINFYSEVLWKRAHLSRLIPYNWAVVCALDLFICTLLIITKNRAKSVLYKMA